tara:strand:+ start:894 stop:1049 length:156 start_codon:yes stop_codon:yes gene_type:complete
MNPADMYYYRDLYELREKQLRELISFYKKGQGPHVSRGVVIEKLTKILEEE